MKRLLASLILFTVFQGCSSTEENPDSCPVQSQEKNKESDQMIRIENDQDFNFW